MKRIKCVSGPHAPDMVTQERATNAQTLTQDFERQKRVCEILISPINIPSTVTISMQISAVKRTKIKSRGNISANIRMKVNVEVVVYALGDLIIWWRKKLL